MATEKPHWLSTAETADALGVTPKALRLYEARGLVRPNRTGAGWRAYGPEALARLHQIVALKGQGLSLSRIGELLHGRLCDLDAVLALQEQALRVQRAEADRALARLGTARARLQAGEALSLDDLTTLTKETVMDRKLSDEEWSELFDPLVRKHYSPEQLETLTARRQALAARSDWDQGRFHRAWGELIAEAARLQDPAGPNRGDPTTPAAADLARRWMDMVAQFDGGDPEVRAKSKAMWTEALSEPETAAKLPFSKEVWLFVAEANAARLHGG